MMRPSQLHVLPLVILLVTFNSAQCTPVCTLCSDGSTTTKPDYFIGLTNPVLTNTCQDLSDTVLFFYKDALECQATRGYSALCGCPVAENACSICKGSQNITRPQQLLDGLVDLGDNIPANGLALTFGNPLTCAFTESVMQLYEAEQTECLELPFDDLHRYCGCPNEDEEESNECTLCPGGEIVPHQSGVDTFINLSNQEIVSCEKAKTLAAQTKKGSEVCNQIQRVSTVCGCPVPENACRLCKAGGYMTEAGTLITTPSGENVRCDSFEAQLHNFKSNSIECTSLDESYADGCGCAETVPCSLCVGGDEVPFPEQELKGLELEDGGTADLLEHTCGALSKAALNQPDNSQACIQARRLAHLCGCKPRAENTCTLCAGGDIMSNPFQELQVYFGAVGSIMPEKFKESTPYLYSSCKLTESVFASLYTQDDSWCYWNQLVRGEICGCPDNSEIKALVWTQRSSGILSLSGSLLIILSIITKPRNVRWSPYNQIVLSISFFDSLSSIAYIIGTSLTPKELGLHGSIGNEATCGFQAWLFQIGIASVYYSVLLCVYFLLVVKYDWTERRFNKVAKWVHLGVGTIGLIMAFAVIPFASPDWRWCYLGTPPQAASWLPGLFFFVIPVALCILAMTVLTVIFVRHVQQVYRKTQSKSMKQNRKGKGQKRGSLASRAFWQSVWFLAVFYAVWPLQFAAFVVPTVPSNYWIYLLAAIFGPLQGFLNALVVFCRDRKSIQRRANQSLKKLLPQRSTKSTNTGSSETVGAVLAAGEEAKQPVECSINSEEAAQLDIGIGQLDRLEEEEKTPEAALDGEGNISDDDLDDLDEGLLEHAVNSGLVNDDDCELFRASLARIQRRPSRFVVE